MVTDQQRNARSPGDGDQLAHFVELHADRFFQQQRHPGGEAVEGGGDMQVVRIGDDRRLRPGFFQQPPMIAEPGHAGVRGERLALRIGHRTQARAGDSLQAMVMLAAHVAGADEGDAKRCVQGGPQSLFSCSSQDSRTSFQI